MKRYSLHDLFGALVSPRFISGQARSAMSFFGADLCGVLSEFTKKKKYELSKERIGADTKKRANEPRSKARG